MNIDKKNTKPEIFGMLKKVELMDDLNSIRKIGSRYDNYVSTKKETFLYELVNGEFVEKGVVSKNFRLELDGISPDLVFFKIKNTNYYIRNDSVSVSSYFENDTRYEKYVVFNNNIVTKNETTFYKSKDVFISINKSFNLPIIIKDSDKYYVKFNGELFYVKKADVKQIISSNNTNKETTNQIRTLTYHTVYNPKTEKCYNASICHSIEQFDSHMKYISENNYFTLTMKELEMFLDGKIRIPKKSVVITLDDGSNAYNAVNIVEKYKVNATYFIITSQFDVPKIKTTYMEYQAHTHNLHNNWKCSGGNQGGELLCSSEEKIINDISMNREKLGGDVFALAYPFFDYNERVIKILGKAGIRLAFIGQGYTNGYATSLKTNKMEIPRKTIFSTDSVQTLKSYLN